MLINDQRFYHIYMYDEVVDHFRSAINLKDGESEMLRGGEARGE